MPAIHRFTVTLIVLLAARAAWSEQAYYAVPLPALKLTDGELPKADATENSRHGWRSLADLHPRVVVDGDAEAYLSYERGRYSPHAEARELFGGMAVHVRGPKGRDVTGHVYLPRPGHREMVDLRFSIATDKAEPAAEKEFYEAKEAHYRALRDRRIPGTAWFRYEQTSASRKLRESTKDEGDSQSGRAQGDDWRRRREIDRTYALFTGGRAVSENLQLDRDLATRGKDVEKVPLDSIRGITVEEFDWSAIAPKETPKADALARYIPADQHVVFFPSFAAAARVADEAKNQGTPILRLVEPRAEDARTQQRYERQLGCSLNAASRLIGPRLIKSIALTGSDPYYRTGTDVAVLFETDQPEALDKLLGAQAALAAAGVPNVEQSAGKIDGVSYQLLRSPDRVICSYRAVLGDAVVLANSPHQIKRVAQLRAGKLPSIASTGEYRFFRTRYPLGADDETALLIISDATIRRWCGPRWRIATSRRLRAAATIAEVQAAQMKTLVDDKTPSGPIHTSLPLAEGEKLTLCPAGVLSSTQGTLTFLTPIAEIPMTEVTKPEAEGYERWRDGYERYWNVGFDPIAFRITVDKDRLAGDLTVMPLISATRYRELIDVAAGGEIQEGSGDPHDSLIQFVIAVNKKSRHFRGADSLAGSMKAGLGLGWLGDSVSFYLDQGPFWDELTALAGDEQKLEDFLERNYHRAPAGLRAEVADGFQLAAFLAAGRAWLEQTSPGMLHWETIEHDGDTYVKVTPTDKARGRRARDGWAIYYAASGDGLIVTLDEDVLRRALARQKERVEARATAQEESPDVEVKEKPATQPWLGKNVALRADRRILDIVNELSAQQYRRAMQREAWNNLPILNEWRRRYPGRNPVEVNERVWGVRLVCPGGGRYVWNPRWQTMESTTYGHPGQPKPGPATSPLLDEFRAADFGLTFENNGLRAKVELDRKKSD